MPLSSKNHSGKTSRVVPSRIKTMSWLSSGTGGDLVPPPKFMGRKPVRLLRNFGSKSVKAPIVKLKSYEERFGYG